MKRVELQPTFAIDSIGRIHVQPHPNSAVLIFQLDPDELRAAARQMVEAALNIEAKANSIAHAEIEKARERLQ